MEEYLLNLAIGMSWMTLARAVSVGCWGGGQSAVTEGYEEGEERERVHLSDSPQSWL